MVSMSEFEKSIKETWAYIASIDPQSVYYNAELSELFNKMQDQCFAVIKLLDEENAELERLNHFLDPYSEQPEVGILVDKVIEYITLLRKLKSPYMKVNGTIE